MMTFKLVHTPSNDDKEFEAIHVWWMQKIMNGFLFDSMESCTFFLKEMCTLAFCFNSFTELQNRRADHYIQPLIH
jgi:hypothetical protein